MEETTFQTVPSFSPQANDATGGKIDERDRFIRRLKTSKSRLQEVRNEAKKYWRAYASDVWPDGVKETIEDQGRPAVVFNYALSTINAIAGSDQSDRKEARFLGISGDLRSETVGGWYTDMVRYVYNQSSAHRQETMSIFDMLITGYGFVHGYLDDRRLPAAPRLRYVSMLNMLWDPDYQEDNLGDSRWIINRTRLALEDAEAMWPGRGNALRGVATSLVGDHSRTAVASNYGPSARAVGSPTGGELFVDVYEYQWRDREKWWGYIDQESGNVVEGEGSPPQEVKDFAAEQGIAVSSFPREVFYRSFYAGREEDMVLLSGQTRIPEDMYTYRCMTGFRRMAIRAGEGSTGSVRHFGLMGLIYEPQLWSAKALSLLIEQLGRNTKGGGFIEQGAVENPDAFIHGASEPGSWQMVANGALSEGRIKEKGFSPYPSNQDRLYQTAIEAIPHLSAVTDWVKGTAQQERSNVLISNLQAHAMVVLNPILEPIAGTRMDLAKLTASMVRLWVSEQEINKILTDKADVPGLTVQQDPMTGQMIPVLNESGQPLRPSDFMMDTDLLRYVVEVDLGSASVTAKYAMWQNLMNGFMQSLVEAGMTPVVKHLMPYVLENAPGIPAYKAKELAAKVQQELELESQQGVIQAFVGLDPESQIAAIQQLDPSVLQQLMPEQPPQENENV